MSCLMRAILAQNMALWCCDVGADAAREGQGVSLCRAFPCHPQELHTARFAGRSAQGREGWCRPCLKGEGGVLCSLV